MAYWVVGIVQALLGNFVAALQATTHADTLGQALQDPHIQSYAAFTTGWVEAMQGNTSAGLTACYRADELAVDPVNLAHAAGALGAAYLEHEEATLAIFWLRQAVQFWQQCALPPLQGWLTALLADAYCIQGDLETAETLAAQGHILVEVAAFPFASGLVQRVQGRIALRRGVLADAAMALSLALTTFATIEARFELGRTHLDSARLAHAYGDRATIVYHLTAAWVIFQALPVPVYSARSRHAAQTYGVQLPDALS